MELAQTIFTHWLAASFGACIGYAVACLLFIQKPIRSDRK
jgi:hypothetical protein